MKVAVLIDGFNLYYHMDNDKYRKYKWLNFSSLFRNFVNSGDTLSIHYFTTINYEDIFLYKIKKEKFDKKKKRHLTLIKAEEAYGVIVHYGNFKNADFVCRKCGHKNRIRKEKQTDVGIGSYLTYLAFSLNIEKFILLSADTDLISSIKLVKENAPQKSVDLVLPPNETASQISDFCDKTYVLTEEVLRNSRFPIYFENRKTKEMIVCPEEWRWTKI